VVDDFNVPEGLQFVICINVSFDLLNNRMFAVVQMHALLVTMLSLIDMEPLEAIPEMV
jgi:hypothetical protein